MYRSYYEYTNHVYQFTNTCVSAFYRGEYEIGLYACVEAIRADPFNRQTYTNAISYNDHLPHNRSCLAIPDVNKLGDPHFHRFALFAHFALGRTENPLMFNMNTTAPANCGSIASLPPFLSLKSVVYDSMMNSWMTSNGHANRIDVVTFGPRDQKTRFITNSLMAQKFVVRHVDNFFTQEGSFFLHKARLLLFLHDEEMTAWHLWEPAFMVGMLFNDKMVVCEEIGLQARLQIMQRYIDRKFIDLVPYKRIVSVVSERLRTNGQPDLWELTDLLETDRSALNLLP